MNYEQVFAHTDSAHNIHWQENMAQRLGFAPARDIVVRASEATSSSSKRDGSGSYPSSSSSYIHQRTSTHPHKGCLNDRIACLRRRNMCSHTALPFTRLREPPPSPGGLELLVARPTIAIKPH